MLDLVSVAVGAVHDPLVEQAREALSSLFGSENGKAKIWGENGNYPPVPAAMINAMHAHTLELDDVHTASKTHGSASLIPSGLGLCPGTGEKWKGIPSGSGLWL